MDKKIVIPRSQFRTFSDSHELQFGFDYIVDNFDKLPHIEVFKMFTPLNSKKNLIDKIKNLLPEDTIFNKINLHGSSVNERGEIESYEDVYYVQAKKFIIFFNKVSSNIDFTDENDRKINKYFHYIKIFAESEESIPSELTKIIIEHSNIYKTKVEKKSTINVIRQSDSGFSLTNIPLNKSEVDIDLHYNDDFKGVHEKVISSISKTSKSLFLFHGIPGTGKTSYLRYLASLVDRKFIFVPPNLTNVLSSPSFIEFLLEQKDSCLVIEDAENILKKRVTGSSQEMSNLLNITDGLLSDVLNISVICTFNSPLSEIDDALMRKGRLTVRYEFGKLSKEKTNRLAEKLNLPLPNKELSLADTFNYEDDSYATSRASIGFNLK